MQILQHGSWPEIVRIICHEKTWAKATGIYTGIAQATKDVINIQDVDLEYDPKDLEIVLRPIADGQADVVYGSRFLGTHRAFLFWHYVGNKLLTLLTNVLYNNMLGARRLPGEIRFQPYGLLLSTALLKKGGTA